MEKQTRFERETIVNFNEGELLASVFTYSRRWQVHMERKLGLIPVMVNGRGGKEYLVDKRLIRLPLVPRQLSAEQKEKLRGRLAVANAAKGKVLVA